MKYFDKMVSNIDDDDVFLDILTGLKAGDSYRATLSYLARNRFGGFLLLTALPRRSLHRLSGHA